MSDKRKDAALANRSSGTTYRPVQQSIARTIIDADTCSLKRLAWAFGCAPKGSSEEAQLEMILLKRAAAIEAMAENNALRAETERLRTLVIHPGSADERIVEDDE